MAKTLKDYIVEFQAGNTDVLNSLIQFNEVKDGDTFVTEMRIADKALNSVLVETKRMYYYNFDSSDIDALFMRFLVDVDEAGNEKGIMYKADTSFEPQQIVNWATMRWKGFVKNEVGNVSIFNSNVVSEADVTPKSDFEETDPEDDNFYISSLYDKSSMNSWLEAEYNESYVDFLDTIGGLEKLLSDKQFEILTLHHDYSKADISRMMGCSKANVTQTINSAHKAIKKSYVKWRTVQLISTNKNTESQEITQFLDTFDRVLEVDIDDSFDYFRLVTNWIEDNSTVNNDMSQLQANKALLDEGMDELILDNCLASQERLITKVLSDTDGEFTTRERDRFVNAVIGALRKYLEVEKELASDCLVDIVNAGEKVYDKVKF